MNYLLLIILQYYGKPIAAIMKLSFVILIMSFIAYSKHTTETIEPLLNETCEPQSMSSISLSKRRYEINDAASQDDYNKQTLLLDLYDETLVRKKNKTEIPKFILAFFDSLSGSKKFELANPGELWSIADIMNFSVRKIYDSKKKQIIDVISPGCKNLPTQQLVYFGMGKNMALFSYYSGGMRIVQHVAMIKFKENKIVDLWMGSYLDIYFTTEKEIKNCIGKKRPRANENC